VSRNQILLGLILFAKGEIRGKDTCLPEVCSRPLLVELNGQRKEGSIQCCGSADGSGTNQSIALRLHLSSVPMTISTSTRLRVPHIVDPTLRPVIRLRFLIPPVWRKWSLTATTVQ
jgi:hypothetical protein